MKGILNRKTLMLVSLLLFLILLVGCFPLINQSPIITSTPITLAEVNELYTYEVEATDPDGNPLTYSLEVKPSGMTIISATGLIKWTPAAKGDYAVVVKVTDGTLDITQSFTIVVSEAEEPGYTPVITSTPITTATVGVVYTYDVNATDLNDDTLTYSLTTYPSGMTITSATGLIWWTPTSAQVGNNLVTVKAFDGALSDTQSFIITVSTVEPGLTGIVVLPETMALLVGESGTITSVIAYYSDGSTTGIALGNCTYSSSVPEVATVIASEGYTVNAIAKGTTTITVDYAGKSDTIVVTVSEPEPEPEIELTGIVVDPKTMNLVVGGSEDIKSVTATYEIRGTEVTIALGECDYVSNPTGIVTVDDGLVEAIAEGTTTITVSYKGKTDTLDVTVEAVEVTGPVQNINTGGYYDTIQVAINTASADDTIEVSAGTYEEVVTVDKSLTLLGAKADVDPRSGAWTSGITTINAGEGNNGILVTASNVTINGFRFTENGTFDQVIDSKSGIYVFNENGRLTGIVIKNCWGDANYGSGVTLRDVLNPTVEYCYFSGNGFGTGTEENIAGIAGQEIIGGSISNNECFNNTNYGIYLGCGGSTIGSGRSSSSTSGIVVSDNELHGNGKGIQIIGLYGNFVGNITVEGNDIHDNGRNGMKLTNAADCVIDGNQFTSNGYDTETIGERWEYGVMLSAYGYGTPAVGNLFTGNTFSGNNLGGIYIYSASAGGSLAGTVVRSNDFIEGSLKWGINNTSTDLVDAKDNWWGDKSGPTHSSNSGGIGDKVSDAVDFTPWTQ